MDAGLRAQVFYGFDPVSRLSLAPPRLLPERGTDRGPIVARFQRYGGTWLALARPSSDRLVLVVPDRVVELPARGAHVRWRARLGVARLSVASSEGTLRFTYRRPGAALLEREEGGIWTDLAYFVAWRFREGTGLEDLLATPDWFEESPLRGETRERVR
ncbi:MAG TPA: hypothetical protein VN238_13925 [Solirubrobacteraceae bacterium]|nr:hypothetical protein [Solirubrobacteraceae bacterium]